MGSSVAKNPFDGWFDSASKNTDNQIIVRQKITELAKKLFVKEQLQVGIIIAENEFNHREHWYLFMSSRRRNGHTLSEVSMEKWAKEWCKENCGKHVHWDNGARIRPVNDVKGLSSYLPETWSLRILNYQMFSYTTRNCWKNVGLKVFQPNLVNPANLRRRTKWVKYGLTKKLILFKSTKHK
jgi:hypothetical protein